MTGTGSLSVPIYASPGRAGFGPQLTLTYDSGAGNGPFGLGWSLSLPAITRKTEKGLPRYLAGDDADVFLLSGAEDLVPELTFSPDSATPSWKPRTLEHTLYGSTYRVQLLRPRLEGLFARIERWTNVDDPTDVFWRSMSRDNITTWYGRTGESRIYDPSDRTRVFSWLICETHDDRGNVMVYRYRPEDSRNVAITALHERNRLNASRSANRYLERICYGNEARLFPGPADFHAAGPAL